MKTSLLIIFVIGMIGFVGIAFAAHDPNQSQIHSIILPPELKEKTFEEFMEWCEPNYGELCIELEENRIPNILSPLKQFKSGILLDEIQCKESLILIAKHNGFSACVTPETKTNLIQRGWMKTQVNVFDDVKFIESAKNLESA